MGWKHSISYFNLDASLEISFKGFYISTANIFFKNITKVRSLVPRRLNGFKNAAAC